jgi:RHS repeat-associated protein
MNIVYFLISVILFFPMIGTLFTIKLIAQEQNDSKSSFCVSLPSPTPAALGKYGDIPVSMYTGVPEISVPLYKVSSRTLSLDIKLTYHAGGNKPQEVPGWTGIGWSLDAGGVITRTVMGKPDEYDYFASSPNPGVNKSDNGYTDEVVRQIVMGNWDSQPDRYFFNFAGRSGQFVFKPDGSVSLGKCEKIKIEEPSDNTFIITIEDGTKYYFEDYEMTFSERSVYKSSWWLTKIVSAIGSDTIKFTYSPYFNLQSVSLPWEEDMIYYSGPISFDNSGDGGGNTSAVRLASIVAGRETINFDMSDRSDTLDKKLNNISISVDGNVIKKFHLSYTDVPTERLLLNSVQESGPDNSTLSPYQFSYCGPKLPVYYGGNADHWGYYNKCGLGMPAVKFLYTPLSHDSISAGEINRDPDPTLVKAELLTTINYPTGGSSNFDYESNDYGNDPATTIYSWSRLATCGSGSRTIIDSKLFSLNSDGSVMVSASISTSNDCEAYADLTNMDTGEQLFCIEDHGQRSTQILKLPAGNYQLRAKGSTGGTDGSVAASITASLKVSQVVENKKLISGGVRIRRITQLDALGSQKIKEYQYVESDSSRSSGKMVEAVPKYVKIYTYPKFNGLCAPMPDGYAITISNYPRSGNGLTQGSPVGYSKVTELLGTNGCYGKSIYSFKAHTGSPTAYSLLAPSSSNDWRYGQLLSESHYNAAGILQYNKKYDYTYTFIELVVGWVFSQYTYGVCVDGYMYRTDREECNDESGLVQLASETTTNFDQNGQNPIAFTKQYFYENPNHLQVTKIIETNSDGKRRVTKMRYPLDYANTSSSSDLMLQTLDSMQTTRYMQNAVIEKWITESMSADTVFSGQIILYRLFGNQVLPYQRMVLSAANPITNFASSTSQNSIFNYDSRYSPVENYTSYDKYGHLLSGTDANGNQINLFYGSNTDPFNNNAPALMNCSLTGIRRYKNSSSCLQTSAQYDAFGNITQIKDVDNNQSTNFQYDSFARLQKIVDPLGNTAKTYNYFLAGSGISSSSPNYVSETAFRSSSDSTVTKTYIDGLGYDIQKQISFGDNDIVMAATYDNMRRPQRTYRPFQLNTAHSYDANYHNDAKTYYNGMGVWVGDNPYSETSYFNDALNRTQLQGAPGDAFKIGSGKEVKYSYWTDIVNSWTRTRKLDENNQAVDTYKDFFGNVARTVVDSGGLNLTTNFAYDIMGHLIQSIPPDGNAYKTTYSYNMRSLVTQKTSPDAGTVQYLYDKNGNLRFIKDANHTGSANNVLNNSGGQFVYNTTVETFTLTMPTQVNVTLGWRGGTTGSDRISISANGAVLLALLTNYQNPSVQGNIILPKGTYTDSVKFISGISPCVYSVSANNNYEFIYNKYDALNRLIEQGESISTSASADFTQTNANNASFPASNCLVTKALVYDTASNDALVSGQQTNLKGKLSYSFSYQLGTLAMTTFYSYDALGRVAWVVQKSSSTTSKKINYSYNNQGNVIQKSYTDLSASSNNYNTYYEYDKAGRLSKAYSGISVAYRVKDAEYTYNASGALNQLILGATPAQTINYFYNERDWLTQCASSNFWEHLGYNLAQEIGGTPQWNGNISWTSYFMNNVNVTIPEMGQYPPSAPNTTSTVGYLYSYDHANRLLSANYGGYIWNVWGTTSIYTMPAIRYDSSGNIRSLQRYGNSQSMMDNLSYSYTAGTNRLASITNSVGSATQTYTYDANGNATSDSYRGIAFIIYDINNLPVTVYKTSGAIVQYYYDAIGNRIQKYDGSANTWYVQGADGKTEVITTATTTAPTYTMDNAGQILRNGSTLTRYYYLKDHLGSIKMMVDASGNVQSYNDYYPYGMTMPGRSGVNGADTRFRFIGVERDDETGYNATGPRFYDSRIGRFGAPDPLAVLSPGYSSYIYARNNPIRFSDPRGLVPGDSLHPLPVADIYVTEERQPRYFVTEYYDPTYKEQTYVMREINDPLTAFEYLRPTIISAAKALFTAIPPVSFVNGLRDMMNQNDFSSILEDEITKYTSEICKKLAQEGNAETPELKDYVTGTIITMLMEDNMNITGPEIPHIIFEKIHNDIDTIYFNGCGGLYMRIRINKNIPDTVHAVNVDIYHE